MNLLVRQQNKRPENCVAFVVMFHECFVDIMNINQTLTELNGPRFRFLLILKLLESICYSKRGCIERQRISNGWYGNLMNNGCKMHSRFPGNVEAFLFLGLRNRNKHRWEFDIESNSCIGEPGSQSADGKYSPGNAQSVKIFQLLYLRAFLNIPRC